MIVIGKDLYGTGTLFDIRKRSDSFVLMKQGVTYASDDIQPVFIAGKTNKGGTTNQFVIDGDIYANGTAFLANYGIKLSLDIDRSATIQSAAIGIDAGKNNAFGQGQAQITNAGSISATVAAIEAEGFTKVTLVNTGSIIAESRQGDAVELAGADDFVENTSTGTISGAVGTGAGSDVLTNSGAITGDVTMSSAAEQADTLTNTGSITGQIVLGGGNDTIDTHLGVVSGAISGGAGNDTYTIRGTEQITDASGTDTVVSYGDYRLASGLENLTLMGAAHLGVGNAGGNTLVADGLGDTLAGGAGNDTLYDGDGDDTLNGGTGNDRITATYGNNTIYAGAGDDTIVSGLDADQINGGAGTDTLTYSSSTDAVVVSLLTGLGSGGFADGDVITGVDTLVGSQYADTLTGGSFANTLNGGAGNDTLDGGDGDDVLIGGAGADALIGGTGFNTASYATAGAAVTINGTTGVNTGDAAGDSYSNIQAFTLSGYNDTFINSYNAPQTVHGGAGDDTITFTNASDDTLYGDAGNDTLTGSATRSTTFGFSDVTPGTAGGWGTDTITNFKPVLDTISFVGASAIHAFSDLTIGQIQGTNSSYIRDKAGDEIIFSGVSSTLLSIDTNIEFG